MSRKRKATDGSGSNKRAKTSEMFDADIRIVPVDIETKQDDETPKLPDVGTEQSPYEAEGVKLINTDCLYPSGFASVPSGSVSLILCDPPFGVTSRNDWDVPIDIEGLFKEVDRVLSPRGCAIFFGQGMFTAQLMLGPWKKYWRYNLIWQKNKPRGFLNAKKMPLRYHEDIIVFYRQLPTYNPQMVETNKAINACTRKATSVNYGAADGGDNTRAGKTDRYPGSIITVPVVNAEDPNMFHPTQKPVALLELLVKTYSNEGDVVLDPCFGSASCCVATMKANRRFIGFEKDTKFFSLAVKRIRDALPE